MQSTEKAPKMIQRKERRPFLVFWCLGPGLEDALAAGCDNETLAETVKNLYSRPPQGEKIAPRRDNARGDKSDEG